MRSISVFSAIGTALSILTLAIFTNIFGQSQAFIRAAAGQANMPALTGSPADASGSLAESQSHGLGAANILSTIPMPASTLLSSTVLPSDNSINQDEYIIGSGDVLFAAAVEGSNVKYTIAIDQTGKAFIPNIGLIEIGKTSYAGAKKIITEYISSKLKNTSAIYVTLIQTKDAAVSFTGTLRSPGSYNFQGTTRLLDAVRTANGGELPPLSEADLRRVQCTNGENVIFYDLLAYLYKGDASQNPYVYPGDRVHIHATTNKVFVSGALKTPRPGFYPLKNGETVSEFLSMFTLDNTADLDDIIIHQSIENNVRAVSISTTDYVLNDLDAITIPLKKNQPGIYAVSITGEIASPGSYPIIENLTSARQLIERAGGTTENANVEQAVILRSSKNLPVGFNAEVSRHVGAVRPERGTSVAMASSTTDHTIIRLINYNADKIILEPEDKIVIPKRDRFVYISGSVRSPGAYPFVRGKSSSYYVTQAGGHSKNADKTNTQVYLKYDDAVQAVEPNCIEPGSVIVVPASVQYKFLSQVALPLVSALATTIGVALAIYNTQK